MIIAPPLPYPEDALEPFLSVRTVHYHRCKQERYVENTNELVQGTLLEDAPLSLIVERTASTIGMDPDPSDWVTNLFEQSSQALNHALMWASMSPPRRDGRERILPRPAPYHVEALAEQWKDEADGLFASGWVWLVRCTDGRLAVESTQDADRPRMGEPLLVMDVWEHAYFLDYPDAKGEYVDAWWGALANWDATDPRYGHYRRTM